MGITNPVHLAFIAIIALIVLGPKRLPDLARSLGEGMRQFRDSLETASQPDHDEVLTPAMVQPQSPEAPMAATDFPATAASPFGTVSPPPPAAGEHAPPVASVAPPDAPSPPVGPGPADQPRASDPPATS